MVGRLMLFFGLIFGWSGTINQVQNQLDQINKLQFEAKYHGFWNTDSPWADSVLSTMSLDEKIGQLFMVAAYSNKGQEHIEQLKKTIQKNHLGGLIFFQGKTADHIRYVNQVQKVSKIPLFIGMDAEWGLNMRLSDAPAFPREMTLGAIRNHRLVKEMGQEIARHCKRVGVHINFAPVVDVNSNPDNPVINSRSFGEDVRNVSDKGIAYMRGMQDEDVMACAKHFPGHGDTDSDSHKTLPVVKHNMIRLKNIEFPPFQRLFNEGVASTMVAHLNIPSLDSVENMPATLSYNITTELLRKEMNFQGLAFTDALNMKGVADHFPPGESDLRAFMAGNDVLLFPLDVPKAFEKFHAALQSGKITEKQITERAYRILKAKEFYKVHKQREIAVENWDNDMFGENYKALRTRIAEESITLLRNDEMLPVSSEEKVAILVIGPDKMKPLRNTLADFISPAFYHLPSDFSKEDEYRVFYYLSEYDKVFVFINGANQSPSKNFGLGKIPLKFVNRIAGRSSVALFWLGNPYALQKIKDAPGIKGVSVAYQNDDYTQIALAKAICGATAFEGVLPVTIPDKWVVGASETTQAKNYLVKGTPNEVGIATKKLERIDSLMQECIRDKATPGGQIVVARSGKIVFNRSYGSYTYEGKEQVKSTTLYDLASLTKILSTTLCVMRLYDEGLLDLRGKLGDYLNFIPDTNPYYHIQIREMMNHSAGFQSWIPFFQYYVDNEAVMKKTFKEKQSADYTIRVASEMFAIATMRDTIFKRILQEPLRDDREYLYSDLGFYFLKEVVERITRMNIEDYVQKTFYQPMQLHSLGYHPLSRFEKKQIAPTEYDSEFRKQLLQGDVHDPGAAMLGGVSGHAGLFGNARDVAILMQMLLNGGEYGGERYIQKGTIELFTRTQSDDPEENRRGLGFDKPVRDGGPGPTFDGISFESFGHSGFTGTFAWADPEEEIVYVFLSNRVYPSSTNRKLIKDNVRSEIQRVIYEALVEIKNPDKETYKEE